MEAKNEQERKTLRLVLAINAFMFCFELVLGLFAQSTALIADSLDMFADASIYALSLYAVGRSTALKTRSAKLSGIAQIILASLVLADVLRRLMLGSEPVSGLMMGVGVIALFANTVCLSLIGKHKDGGVHMRASLIFSKNDVIANLGIILSGALVWLLDNRYPDIIIGLIIAIVVLRGGLQILKETNASQGCS